MTLEYKDPTDEKVEVGDSSVVAAQHVNVIVSSTPTPCDKNTIPLPQQQPQVELEGGRNTATHSDEKQTFCSGFIVFLAIILIAFVIMSIVMSISTGRWSILGFMLVAPVVFGLCACKRQREIREKGRGWRAGHVSGGGDSGWGGVGDGGGGGGGGN